MSSDHAIRTWIKHFGEKVAFCDRVYGVRISRTEEKIASVTDAVEKIFFAAYPIRKFFSQFAGFHMDIMSAIIYTTTYSRYRSEKRIEIFTEKACRTVAGLRITK
jgi:hypothetical protein